MSTPEVPVTTAPEQPEALAKPQTLDELLADLDDDRRKAVLGEVTKARSEAKGLRERLKAAEPKAAEHDRALEAQKTAEERAEEARIAAEARAAAATQRVARAEIKAALAGVVDDPDHIIDDLNLGRFVDADGDIDAAAVEALRVKYAALGGGTRRAPRPDLSQGSAAAGSSTAADPASELASILQGAMRR